MSYYRVKNWEEFQHYKDRTPPWIKLHRTLLTDYEFSCLQDASKLHLMMIWLFASQSENKIPDDPAYLQRTLHLDKKPDLKLLESKGFIISVQDASGPLAECKQSAPLEEESRGEERREDICRAVLSHLNEQAGRAYQPVDANLKLIRARLNEYDKPTLIRVIDKKCSQWKNDKKYAEYLRPATLFNAEKCAQYVGTLGRDESPWAGAL